MTAEHPRDPWWLAVRQTVERYFVAVDSRDWVMLASCFADDAAMATNGRHPGGVGATWSHGTDEIVEAVRRVERFTHSTHVLGNVAVQSDAEGTATAITHAVAYLVDDSSRPDGPVLLTRGVRYTDVVVDGDSGWVLCRRLHVATWQTSAPLQRPELPTKTNPGELR